MGTTASDLTVAVQDYLKAIYALETAGERVTTSALAARMGVSAPSATAMTKRLAELGLVERAPYRGVALTEDGRRSALEMLRHHRLLERYLADRLGLTLDEVHAEADRLEHALSEELEAKIDAELGYPTRDPHGDPIPDRELRLKAGRDRTLADLKPGERASVSRVPNDDPELLRYLGELGLVPGSDVELVSVAPFAGPVTVRTKRGNHAISCELADQIDTAARSR
ncbi:MAG: DtxR family transcriptional regulator [Actinobacteria bacterium RBG_16_68_12]|nr:MAG: DtxR family transcriptional regulator [Actinobacteria bacterium RBG_16_68_12]